MKTKRKCTLKLEKPYNGISEFKTTEVTEGRQFGGKDVYYLVLDDFGGYTIPELRDIFECKFSITYQ